MEALPSFVQLMASLGLQEHGASHSVALSSTTSSPSGLLSPPRQSAFQDHHTQSFERDHSLSIGRKAGRFSPYSSNPMYSRRGSLPGSATNLSTEDLQRASSMSPMRPQETIDLSRSYPHSAQQSPTFPKDDAMSSSVSVPTVDELPLRHSQPRISRQARSSKSHQHLRQPQPSPRSSAARSGGRNISATGDSLLVDPELANSALVTSISSLLRNTAPSPGFHPYTGSAPPSAPPTQTTFAPYFASTLESASAPPAPSLSSFGHEANAARYTSSSMIGLEDSTSSFSKRRFKSRNRSQTASSGSDSSSIASPPPLMLLPTLPSTFSIPTIPRSDYVSKRAPHSPDGRYHRDKWGLRSRGPTPPGSLFISAPVAMMES